MRNQPRVIASGIVSARKQETTETKTKKIKRRERVSEGGRELKWEES